MSPEEVKVRSRRKHANHGPVVVLFAIWKLFLNLFQGRQLQVYVRGPSALEVSDIELVHAKPSGGYHKHQYYNTVVHTIIYTPALSRITTRQQYTSTPYNTIYALQYTAAVYTSILLASP